MILSGLPVAKKIKDSFKKDLENFKKEKVRPFLAVVLVGEEPSSLSYLKIKEKVAKELGIICRIYQFPTIASEREIEEIIGRLNRNEFIFGIIVQLPLPKRIDQELILKKIVVNKDIDGFYGNFESPVAQAIMEIINFYRIELKNKNIILVGRGRLVGQPLEKMLKANGFDLAVYDSKTYNLKAKTLKADILISATGIPRLIKPKMVSKNAVVIDAGTAEAGGKVVGDVDPKVYKKVKAYTPVPGGVGPVTVAQLMKNLVEATKKNS